ncbi:MAG: hypothetical protein ACLQU1_38645 [Bryobacteraceae bacterium]
MMSRKQRIDYEILDYALKADPASGYLTDTQKFTQLLRGLFPDIRPEEFVGACKRLHNENRLELRFRQGQQEGPAYQLYWDVGDEQMFLGEFYLAHAVRSCDYFKELRRLIELPTCRGFQWQ